MQTSNNVQRFQYDKVPMFDKTLLGSVQRPIDPAKWDKVLELFEKGKHRETITAILDYVDTDIEKKAWNPEKKEYVIPHGSITVNLKIDEKNFCVTAPFLKLPSAPSIPLLRQVTQLNIFPLNLSNIILEDDHLTFTYSCPIELCEPYKIYDVLREICTYADAYDDQFRKKFGALWIHRPVIKRFPPKYIEYAWRRIHQYLHEMQAYIDYLEKKRLFEFCWDIIIITLMKIDYYLAPQGVLRTDIERTIAYMQDEDMDLMDKIRRGRQMAKQLQDYDRNEFNRNLYVAEIFIPLKSNFTSEMIESYFQVPLETTQKELAGREYMGAVLTIQGAFLNLFYHYIIPEDIKEIITEALVNAAGKPWEEAAAILYEALDVILNQKAPKRKKGFWRGLFSGKKPKESPTPLTGEQQI